MDAGRSVSILALKPLVKAWRRPGNAASDQELAWATHLHDGGEDQAGEDCDDAGDDEQLDESEPPPPHPCGRSEHG